MNILAPLYGMKKVQKVQKSQKNSKKKIHLDFSAILNYENQIFYNQLLKKNGGTTDFTS
jgi:hypothetical protein